MKITIKRNTSGTKIGSKIYPEYAVYADGVWQYSSEIVPMGRWNNLEEAIEILTNISGPNTFELEVID